MAVSGHYWTLTPWLAAQLRRETAPPGQEWRAEVEEPCLGRVSLTGAIHEVPLSRGIVIVVHGLGGCSESYYAVRAARAIVASGLSCLRVNLRGADRSGADIYHAGLIEDLRAAVASESARGYERIQILGYSLGGHVTLRYATLAPDPRVSAVAAVCSPLDLKRSAQTFDERVNGIYRRHVLSGLRDMYAAVARRREMPLSIEDLHEIRSIREWDERAVAPRFGFRDAIDYYEQMSVASRLDRLECPALLVASRNDPMVLRETIEPALAGAAPALTVHWLDRGGHVGFPADFSIGAQADAGLERQIVAWLQDTV